MKKEVNASFQISQKAIIYDPETKKFLIAKQADVDRVFTQKFGPWDLFGGRIDKGEENIPSSLQREILEESGLSQCEIAGSVDMYLAENGHGPVMLIGQLVFYRGGEIVLSEEHTEYAWVTAEEVEKNEEYHEWLKRFVAGAKKRMMEQGYLNDLQRLQADFSNYKKRQQESQKELAGYLIEKLVLDLIPVLDNFRMATNHVPESSKSDPWVTGIQYIEKQLEDVLTANGMQVIEANVGDVFDPRVHEAISQENNGSEEEKSDNAETKIVKVLQKGYKLGDRIIRPVKVTVE